MVYKAGPTEVTIVRPAADPVETAVLALSNLLIRPWVLMKLVGKISPKHAISFKTAVQINTLLGMYFSPTSYYVWSKNSSRAKGIK